MKAGPGDLRGIAPPLPIPLSFGCCLVKERLINHHAERDGTTSLVMAYPPLRLSIRNYEGRLARLNVGLEERSNLIQDLARTLDTAG
jgi:hypothetical protein